MSRHEASQQATQQAIEDYLEALLRDDSEDESQPLDLTASAPQQRHESIQEQQLKSSMLQLQTSLADQPKPASIGLDEPLAGAQVILPDLKLKPTKPEVETLADVVQEIEAAALKQEQAQPVKPQAKPQIKAAPTPVTTPAVEPVPRQTAPQPLQVAAVVDKSGQPPAPPGWINGRPSWAQERFECLLFKVKGLTLAVPLVELGGIIKIDKEPTPLFGQPDWFIGMLRSNNMNVSMVDTAQWVLPPALANKASEPYQLIIRIHESVWGLACNEVDRSISLEPEQVRWRTTLGTRPWLAGTVIEHMCALIDAAAFARLLQEGHGTMQPANLSKLSNLELDS